MRGKVSFTEKQKEVINKKGIFIVKAAPGSGKTFIVAARMARLLREWKEKHRGIAVLSFTNVAWQEIEEYLRKKFGISTPIYYPHFLGTIDSFLNRYLVIPFGNIVTESDKIVLVGPPHGEWNTRDFYKFFPNFTFDLRSNLIPLNPKIVPKNWRQQQMKRKLEKMKRDMWQKGYITQADANYIALQVLGEHRKLGKYLTYRFPLIMIDEAQDTSEIQMAIIDLLIESGLQEVMLIGDPEQAIYEWRDARPEIFVEKMNKWECIELNENWRSSQKICNFFMAISASKKIKALNAEVKDFPVVPQIWEYKEENISDVINKFLRLCKKFGIGINVENIAILSRSNEFVNTKLMKKDKTKRRKGKRIEPWKNPKILRLAESKYRFEQNQLKEAIEIIEKLLCELENKDNISPCSVYKLREIRENHGLTTLRKKIVCFLKSLPTTNKPVHIWTHEVNAIINEKSFFKNLRLELKQRVNEDLKVNDLFIDTNESYIQARNYYIGNIHSVKGKTFEAVLLFVKKGTTGNKKYEFILKQDIAKSEELRNIYVAITRPRKILVIAVPEGEKKVWKKVFEEPYNEK